ncbi:uncharacterized protein LOC119112281 [Pollicipes pollicipes]|uniref:uncharacterized protein LOC119112281 n=1 Tax=Pollicipes pollicipes TaxID=41117 RepID=UPI001885461C|nr:uncharacterized protein LOC119112281 [Pollicipes pollicipes]
MDAAQVASKRKYRLKEQFYHVLAEVGAQREKPYKWKDVITMFIRYLAQRRPSLLDPQDRSRVICEGDPLGRVFGVRHFTKDETKSLLLQHLSPVDEELPAPIAPAAAAAAAAADEA